MVVASKCEFAEVLSCLAWLRRSGQRIGFKNLCLASEFVQVVRRYRVWPAFLNADDRRWMTRKRKIYSALNTLALNGCSFGLNFKNSVSWLAWVIVADEITPVVHDAELYCSTALTIR